jgi:hypothetical protein
MKTRYLITLIFLFALTVLRASAGRLYPEDSLDREYWRGLDAKSKIFFLTAFRHSQGPVVDKTAKPNFQLVTTAHFPALAEKVDQFYKSPDNEHVSLKAAIRISFMEMSGKPQADIDQATKEAREIFIRI